MQIGKHSRKLVQVRKAIRHGSLTADGLLPIEGPILLEEAARSEIEIVDVFRRTGAEVPPVLPDAMYDIPAEIFKSLQDTEQSQGIIATVRPRQYTLGDAFAGAPQLLVVLGRLQDPGNVGTILRIGESFGATGCIALRGTVSFHNSKVVRASTGSIFRLPHTGPESLSETVQAMRAKKIAVAGTSPDAKMMTEQWDWRKPTAILIGNEG